MDESNQTTKADSIRDRINRGEHKSGRAYRVGKVIGYVVVFTTIGVIIGLIYLWATGA